MFLPQLWRFFKSTVTSLFYLFQSDAPCAVYICYLTTIIERIRCRKYSAVQTQFRKESSSLKISNDWFSLHIPYWLSIFERFNLPAKSIKMLEIGSWEGLSSYFILKTLPNAKLTCVDTWAGSDEHVKKDVLSNIEKNFDSNTSQYQDRLTKFKGTSFNFFNAQKNNQNFDLIYVDGSHYGDDVMIDALKGFEHLNVGGIMIFDDYFCLFYKHINDNPAAAINAFLHLKKGQYKMVHVYCHLIIQKTKEYKEPNVTLQASA